VRNPSVSATANGRSITYQWNAPSANGRAITQMQIRIDGGNWQNVANNGSTSATYGYAETHRVEARAQDAEGQWSGVVSDSARTVDPPQPRAWTSRGSSAAGMPGCESASCSYFVFNVENWVPGTYTLSCNDSEGRWSSNSYQVGANDSVRLSCYSGYAGSKWVSYSGPGGSGNAEATTW